MGLKSSIKTGGDYLDLKDLTAGGPVLCIFRIREFQEAEKGKHGYLLPVIADVFVVDGEQANEVHLSEKFIGAITNALRGVRNPNHQKGERPQPPVNEVGDEIVTRVSLKNPGENNSFVVGDEPSATEMAAAGKAYEAAGGDTLWVKAEEQAAQTEPAGVGSRPW